MGALSDQSGQGRDLVSLGNPILNIGMETDPQLAGGVS